MERRGALRPPARVPAKGGSILLRPGRHFTTILLMALLLPHASWARPKSVFRGQAVEWTPDLLGADTVEPVAFQPAWTFSGFAAPLAGDPVAIIGALVGAARDGEVVS